MSVLPPESRHLSATLPIAISSPATAGKGYSVSILWRGGEVDTIFGFEKEDDTLQWIKEKSQSVVDKAKQSQSAHLGFLFYMHRQRRDEHLCGRLSFDCM
jgi:hypothetical protein